MDFHKWTEDGEVLILKRISRDRTTYNNFPWPEGVGAVVECPDWNSEACCGGGLHGWPWGFGLGEGSDYDIIGDIWLVLGAKPEDVVGELDGGAKCKCRRATIRLEGSFGDAMRKVQRGFDGCVTAMAKQAGDSSTAASSGDSCTSQADGKNTIAMIAGTGRVCVGPGGAFALAYYDDNGSPHVLCGKDGEAGIEADTWYCIRDGKIVVAEDR